MREIKFRAWDSVSKGWTDGHYPIGQHISDIEFGYDTENGRYILCQFTGLHDKNGKEIYEGDVLKYDYGQIGFIEFVHGAFRANFNMKVLNPYLHVWVEDKELPRLEVIGNIYEHPHLIE